MCVIFSDHRDVWAIIIDNHQKRVLFASKMDTFCTQIANRGRGGAYYA